MNKPEHYALIDIEVISKDCLRIGDRYIDYGVVMQSFDAKRSDRDYIVIFSTDGSDVK